MKNADLGFERSNVLVGSIDLDYKDLDAAKSSFNAMLNELEANFSAKDAEFIALEAEFQERETYIGNLEMRLENCSDG